MARLIPFVALAVLAVGAGMFWWLFRAAERRDVRQRRRIARGEALADYQQGKAIEDLEKHRERLNLDLDAMYRDRDETG